MGRRAWPSTAQAACPCLNPRVRGADKTGGLNGLPKLPSTPACAGLTSAPCPRAAPCCLYPRVRGADVVELGAERIAGPLPPRARG